MLSASLYIIVCSARNRVRVRLRRLREPRYLAGAVVGAAYIYFSFFARFRVSRQSATRRNARQAQAPATLAALMAVGPALGGLAVLAVTTLSWILPFNSGLLDFSESEILFLFPAPVSRRQLLIHRVLRSQVGLLIGALVIGIVSGTSLAGYTRLRISVAAWILMVTSKIYFTGVTLARARLRSPDGRSRRIAWLPIGVLAAALAVVGTALTRAYRHAPPDGPWSLLLLAGRVVDGGASRVVLWPFTAVVQPLFAQWPVPYLTAIGGSVAVLMALTAWLLTSDEAFHAAVADAVERRSFEPATKKRASTYAVRSTRWALAPVGPPETAFAWKAAMQTFRTVDRRAVAPVVALVFPMVAIALVIGRGEFASILGAFAFVAALFTILLAPQVMRIDMRQDLGHLELLKTWPVKSSAVVRGEMLWPGVLLTAVAWTMIAVAMALTGAVLTTVSVGWRMAGGTAVGIVAPALIFSQLTIHNAVALMFPAWVPLGNQRPRGLDAMGQRLIMLGGTWLLLILSAVPGALAGGIVWFALRLFIGPAALVPAAAVCAMVVGLEVLLATEALGPAYERLDMQAVDRAE